jgi:hypothetical protein
MFGLGAVPAYSSSRPWSPPWSPLFMDWKLRFAPGAATQAGALAPWAYPLPQNTPPEELFTYRWDRPLPPPQDRAFTTSGRILVTPQAADTFARRLERAIDLSADQPDMETIIGMLQTAFDYMLNADVLGQVNSGLNANLLQTSPLVFATPPPDDPVLKFLNGDSNPLFTFTSSPEPGADALRFNPLRAGHASLDALWFVDGWGQVFDVIKAAPAWSPIRAPDLITAQSGMLVELKPRLTQPARLCFDLLSATDDTQRVRIDSTANPVCGWIIPNRIDRSLFVYDAAGNAAGELFLAGEVAGWLPSPRNHKPPHGGKPEVKIENRHLSRINARENTEFECV